MLKLYLFKAKKSKKTRSIKEFDRVCRIRKRTPEVFFKNMAVCLPDSARDHCFCPLHVFLVQVKAA